MRIEISIIGSYWKLWWEIVYSYLLDFWRKISNWWEIVYSYLLDFWRKIKKQKKTEETREKI